MKTTSEYQPKTGQPCTCKPGQQRDNCPSCEGTGMRIDFAAIRAKPLEPEFPAAHGLANGLSARFNPKAKTKFSIAHRKEKNGFYAEYSALYIDAETQEARCPVSLRIYYPGNTCYACIWISGYRPGYPVDYISTQGSGKAGGGGYHKQSAAAQAAINNAGFELSKDIDGRGEGMMRDAVLAIADALGFSGARVHVAHA